jgi:hypothetical protein
MIDKLNQLYLLESSNDYGDAMVAYDLCLESNWASIIELFIPMYVSTAEYVYFIDKYIVMRRATGTYNTMCTDGVIMSSVNGQNYSYGNRFSSINSYVWTMSRPRSGIDKVF